MHGQETKFIHLPLYAFLVVRRHFLCCLLFRCCILLGNTIFSSLYSLFRRCPIFSSLYILFFVVVSSLFRRCIFSLSSLYILSFVVLYSLFRRCIFSLSSLYILSFVVVYSFFRRYIYIYILSFAVVFSLVRVCIFFSQLYPPYRHCTFLSFLVAVY